MSFYKKLKDGYHAFTRGLPTHRPIDILQEPGVLPTLSSLISRELLIIQGSQFPHFRVLCLLERKTHWIDLQEVRVDNHDILRADFASPAHRFFFSCILRPDTKFKIDITIREFAERCIGRFSASLLRSQRRAIPEVQYQQEFFRAAFEISQGSVVICSDYTDTGRGRIDFYMPDQKWGIELLCDGHDVKGHIRRFHHDGVYNKWVQAGSITDYLVLDFRTSFLREKSDIDDSNLVYVVFTEDYQSATLYDHSRQKIGDSIALTGNHPDFVEYLI